MKHGMHETAVTSTFYLQAQTKLAVVTNFTLEEKIATWQLETHFNHSALVSLFLPTKKLHVTRRAKGPDLGQSIVL